MSDRADRPPPPADTPLAAGTRVGEYVIGEPIGSGMYGTVYAAHHPVIDKPAAVKVLAWRYSADPEMVGRFVNEARAASRARHASMIEVFNFGRLPDGRRYHVMERLFGEDLDALLDREGRLAGARVLAILRPIAEALAAAHAAGVTHRDVKPANVFVCAEGPPKLLDFGVAKLLDNPAHTERTATGVAIGTPAYMAPEQCLGEAVGPAVDVYALGVMAFRMLTGRLPFVADAGFAVMSAHVNDPVPAAHRLVPQLNPAVSQALRVMMAKAPAERPAPVAAIDTLEAALAVRTSRAWKALPVLPLLAGIAWAAWPSTPPVETHVGRAEVRPADAGVRDAEVRPRGKPDAAVPAASGPDAARPAPVRRGPRPHSGATRQGEGTDPHGIDRW